MLKEMVCALKTEGTSNTTKIVLKDTMNILLTTPTEKENLLMK